MKPLGITRSQWWVLTGISRHGDCGITQTALARVLDLGKVAVGAQIGRLEARGYAERQLDPGDRRVNRVFLTSKGDAILNKISRVGTKMNAKVMHGISLNDQQSVALTLHHMKSNLIALDTVPGMRSARRRHGVA